MTHSEASVQKYFANILFIMTVFAWLVLLKTKRGRITSHGLLLMILRFSLVQKVLSKKYENKLFISDEKPILICKKSSYRDYII